MSIHHTLPLTMLPDELSLPDCAPGLGMVAATGDLALQAGKAMRATEGGGGVLAARERLMQSLRAGSCTQWRGLVAVALLLDAWPDAPELRVADYDSRGSRFVRSALEATGRATLHLCVAGSGSDACVLGMLDGEVLLVPPARSQPLGRLLPERVTWLDRETGLFADPCAYLNQRDRHLLRDRLEKLKEASVYVRSFADDVAAMDEKLRTDALTGQDQEAWEQRVKAVLGLRGTPGFEQLDAVEDDYVTMSLQSPVLRRFGKQDATLSREMPQVTYRWQGVPFARANSQIGLEQAGDSMPPQLAEAAQRLEKHSRQHARMLGESITHELAGRFANLVPEAKAALTRWRDDAQKTARLPLESMALVWPWDASDPSVRILLRERLGETLAEAALSPFADRLLLIPGGDLGDEALNLACAVPCPEGAAVVLPPLSDSLAAWTDAQSDDMQTLPTDGMRVKSTLDGIQISMTLRGADGCVHITRTYASEEQLLWDAQSPVTIGVWPAVPVEMGRWRSYFASATGALQVFVRQNGQWVAIAEEGQSACSVLALNRLPKALLVRQSEAVLGAALMQGVVCHPGTRGAAVAALDLGASNVSMAVMAGGQVTEVSMPTLLRMPLCCGDIKLESEALPVWPAGPVLPAAVQRYGEGDIPFVDGRICPREALPVLAGQDPPPDTDLMWRVDEHAAASRRILLRQAMLISSFHAVMCGAQSISWRIALPGALSAGARQRLMEEAAAAADWCAEETGLSRTAAIPCASMRSLLGGSMFLRDSGIIRSGMIALDTGSSSAGMAVWLRGMNKPAAECYLPLGVSAMVMSALEERPAMLRDDFSDMPGLDGLALATDEDCYLTAFSRRRLLLDELLGARLAQTSAHMNARVRSGRETRTHALLLLGWAELMTLCGSTLEKIMRNAMLNDYLPMELSLCLCGLGSEVLMQMDDLTRQGMLSFVRLLMQPTHRVRYVHLTRSGYPRREASLGLCQLSAVPEREQPLPPTMPEVCPTTHMTAWFLQQFRACYPLSCELLFPGMVDANGVFSQEAQERILRACERAEGSDEERLLRSVEGVRSAYAADLIACEEADRQAALSAQEASTGTDQDAQDTPATRDA